MYLLVSSQLKSELGIFYTIEMNTFLKELEIYTLIVIHINILSSDNGSYVAIICHMCPLPICQSKIDMASFEEGIASSSISRYLFFTWNVFNEGCVWTFSVIQ